MATSVYIPSPRGLNTVLRTQSGPVGRFLLRKALDVESQAKVNASGRPGPLVDTGRLRGEIRPEDQLFFDGSGNPFVKVVAYAEYAIYVERSQYPFLKKALSAVR